MIDLTFMNYYAPIWIMILLVLLVYGALKLAKFPGNEWTHAITALLISFVFISSKEATKYLIKSIPLVTIVLVLLFISLLVFALTQLKLETFAKPFAWIGFALILIILIFSAFNHFHTLNHLLPGSSDSGLSQSMEDFKDWLYSGEVKDGFVLVLSIVATGFVLLHKWK